MRNLDQQLTQLTTSAEDMAHLAATLRKGKSFTFFQKYFFEEIFIPVSMFCL